MVDGERTPFKYSCRKCPVRNRCIDRSDTSPAIKETIKQAFLSRTDTLHTWTYLQSDCLLLEAEKRQVELNSKKTESLLTRRLRETKKQRDGWVGNIDPSVAPQPLKQVPKPQVPIKPPPFGAGRPIQKPTQPKPPPAAEPVTPARFEDTTKKRQCWLSVTQSGRIIRLPDNGELVLGRYDPNFGIPPDVDLTFEDDNASISRRHARFLGKNGFHTVEEMGGRRGILINDRPIALGKPYRLITMDRIKLGSVEMVYEEMPPWAVDLHPAVITGHRVMISHSGQQLSVPPTGDEIIIGRSDKYVDFKPDIDLSILEEVSKKVSRRHARLVYKPDDPYLYIEDMGSGFGTKINGVHLMLGELNRLTPGDHIWLGGVVLAYNIVRRR